ncbi:MAG: sodium:calcium symporter [Planctomycetaceae bacterium]
MSSQERETWGSRLGVILAVAGSAVGLGNFIRFPGQAAQFGGGAFMIAYAISFLIIGLPIGWAEWAMGRYAGQRGYNSAAGVFHCLLPWRASKYIGVIGAIIPLVIFMYYVVIEAWTLGYTVRFVRALFDPSLRFATVADSQTFFERFVGSGEDGGAMLLDLDCMLPWIVLVVVINLVLIYRGLSAGIQRVCEIGMPVLIVLSLVVLARVLTLGTPDPSFPDRNVSTGLGYMWNPGKTLVVDGDGRIVQEIVDADPASQQARAETLASATPGGRVERRTVLAQLADPDLWLAAAGQIFFSLSVGFGVILVYASYVGPRDDVVLSGLTASATNEFCEVALGGLITLPAAVAFLGVAGVAGQGTFGLGFNVLPMVFSAMPAGSLFGAMFFFVLFIAAITSSLSMLQPGIALLEEALGIGRKGSVGLLGTLTALGTGFVAWFSRDLKALDTLDFWVGTFLIFVLATIQIILFGWAFGIDRGWEELHRGAAIRLPRFFRPVFLYLCPGFLVTIFVLWILKNIVGVGRKEPSPYLSDLFTNVQPVAWLSIGLIAVVANGLAATITSSKRYADEAEPRKP